MNRPHSLTVPVAAPDIAWFVGYDSVWMPEMPSWPSDRGFTALMYEVVGIALGANGLVNRSRHGLAT